MADDVPLIACVRCGQKKPAAAHGVFYGGELGDEIRRKICADCWAEWQEAEVMVINELRLNFMDPESQDVLVKQMREFLNLDGGSSGDGPAASSTESSTGS